MDRVEEIEAAIDGLPPEEHGRIVQWLRVREQRRWDTRLDSDSSGGKLDFLFDEAESESSKGLLRSEEHTSELQSLRHLVCRLLLEKKKQQDKQSTSLTSTHFAHRMPSCALQH